MSCNQKFDDAVSGSDIDFDIRYREADGTYPDATNLTCRVVASNKKDVIVDMDVDNPTAYSSITIETDATSTYLAVKIGGEETAGLKGNLDIDSVIVSDEAGRRTEVTGYYKLCDGGGLE